MDHHYFSPTSLIPEIEANPKYTSAEEEISSFFKDFSILIAALSEARNSRPPRSRPSLRSIWAALNQHLEDPKSWQTNETVIGHGILTKLIKFLCRWGTAPRSFGENDTFRATWRSVAVSMGGYARALEILGPATRHFHGLGEYRIAIGYMVRDLAEEVAFSLRKLVLLEEEKKSQVLFGTKELGWFRSLVELLIRDLPPYGGLPKVEVIESCLRVDSYVWKNVPIEATSEDVSQFGITTALFVHHLETLWNVHQKVIEQNRPNYTLPVVIGYSLSEMVERMRSIVDGEHSTVTDRYIACLMIPQFDFLADPNDTEWIEKLCSEGILYRAAKIISNKSYYELHGTTPIDPTSPLGCYQATIIAGLDHHINIAAQHGKGLEVTEALVMETDIILGIRYFTACRGGEQRFDIAQKIINTMARCVKSVHPSKYDVVASLYYQMSLIDSPTIKLPKCAQKQFIKEGEEFWLDIASHARDVVSSPILQDIIKQGGHLKRKSKAKSPLSSKSTSKKSSSSSSSSFASSSISTSAPLSTIGRGSGAKSENLPPDCYACAVCGLTGAADELFQCSGCRSQYYCSVKCQTSDWETHRKLCKTSGASTSANTPTSSSTSRRPPKNSKKNNNNNKKSITSLAAAGRDIISRSNGPGAVDEGVPPLHEDSPSPSS